MTVLFWITHMIITMFVVKFYSHFSECTTGRRSSATSGVYYYTIVECE